MASEDIVRLYKEIAAELTAPDGSFPINEASVRGHQLPVWAHASKNLLEFYALIDARYGDRKLLVFGDRQHTYREVVRGARKLAAALRTLRSIAPGERVGIAMRNCPEWFLAFIGITSIGAVAAVLNSRGSPEELTAAAELAGCRLIFADERCNERLQQGGCPVPVIGLQQMAHLTAQESVDSADVEIDADAAAAILYTSGTTGRPKGATLTHRNLCSLFTTCAYLARMGLTLTARRLNKPVAQLESLVPAPSVLMTFPLFHISGITNFFSAASGGGFLVLMGRWNPAEALDLIETHRVTALSGPILVVSDLLDQPNAAARMQSLAGMVVGGQATPIALAQRITQLLPRAGQASGWGMTELTGASTSASGPVFSAYPGSCGLPLPLSQLKVASPDGEPMPAGQVGEIWARGANVMQGYWNDPRANAEAFSDGWFKTGDMAYAETNGLLYLVDRRKDMVISAGENIYCAEVERVLGAGADFVEVALFAVPDVRRGERAVAAVVLKPGRTSDAESVMAAVRGKLADYKVPSEVIFDLGPFPRNALGKVDKTALKERYFGRLASN